MKKEYIIGIIILILVAVFFLILSYLNTEKGELIYQKACFGCPETYVSSEWEFINVYTTGSNYNNYFDPYIDEYDNINVFLSSNNCCGYFNEIRILRENEKSIITANRGTVSGCTGCAAPDIFIIKGPAKGVKHIEINNK
ncbi:hypothetical protein KO317_04240 [Candidatus Micrarchaeota archaeon]|jgi:hypothetical protein|nr:hypothetical protein [Candidatus Micrarchaeota archaeon]